MQLIKIYFTSKVYDRSNRINTKTQVLVNVWPSNALSKKNECFCLKCVTRSIEMKKLLLRDHGDCFIPRTRFFLNIIKFINYAYIAYCIFTDKVIRQTVLFSFYVQRVLFKKRKNLAFCRLSHGVSTRLRWVVWLDFVTQGWWLKGKH